jgi:anaerobic selenocysteine-containing dehydrogenase
VYVKDEKVIREEISCTYPEFTDPEYRVPDYNPRGCQKGYQHSRSMYGPDRVLYPMKRKGERGSGQWERITWQQAFEEIGAKVAEVIEKHGPQSVIDDHRTNGLGIVPRRERDHHHRPHRPPRWRQLRLINFMIGDFNVGQYLTFGQFQHTPGIETWFLPDTIIMLSNPIYANIPDVHYMLEARYRGATIVAIAPDKNASAQFADVWVPINWSADPSLWLGVCRILIENGWIDEEFMKSRRTCRCSYAAMTSVSCARPTRRAVTPNSSR